MAISPNQAKMMMLAWLLKAVLFVAALYLLGMWFQRAKRRLTQEQVPSRRNAPHGVSSKDNTRLFGYHIEYVSPTILRAGDHDSCFLYVDAMGEIRFKSLERSHPGGGDINFPLSDEEWDRKYPSHGGQRDLIRRRLIEFAERSAHQSHVVRALKQSGSFWG